LTWQAEDDLPYDPHLFSYEKDIIRFFSKKKDLAGELYARGSDDDDEAQREAIRRKLADGCPSDWPTVVNLGLDHRLVQNRVSR
jgi:hypothetical protein